MRVFRNSGTGALTITMGSAAPTVGRIIFVDVKTAKTVIVRVPTGATGYDDTWKTAFKGAGTIGDAVVNENINLVIEYY
jgi:hypothetical protein